MESLSYLALVVACMLPPLAVEFAFARPTLVREWRTTAFTVLASTLYLGSASIVAIRNDLWVFDEDRITPLHGGGFVFEAWLLILLANAVIAQAVLIGMDDQVQRRLRRRLRR